MLNMLQPFSQPVAPSLHRLAVLLAVTTFPLLWVGGLVTTYKAGMAVPDWPNTYGYNLFLYPWTTWVAGPWDLFIEHGHRLLGALVGMITIGLVVVAWRSTPRGSPWRALSLVALAAVCLQGSLGGMRVLFDQVQLARIHGCVGPLFFAYACALATMSSRHWLSDERRATARDVAAPAKLLRVALLTTCLVYAQLVVGAHLRHLPIGFSSAAFRVALAAHLFLAAAVAAHGMLALFAAWRVQGDRSLRAASWGLAALISLQLTLGAATWVVKYNWPAWVPEQTWTTGFTVSAESMVQAIIVTGHVATGALILSLATMTTLLSWRHCWASAAQQTRGDAPQRAATVDSGIARLQLAEAT